MSTRRQLALGALRPGRVACLTLLGVLAVSCGPGRSQGRVLPPPAPASSTSTPPATVTTSTIPVDYSAISLDTVPGEQARPPVENGPGPLTLAGKVMGPDGPVGGAIVRVQRFVGDTAFNSDVTTGSDGSWQLPGVQGGRYRLRAWRAPDLAMTQPEVVFLAANDSRTFTLTLERKGGTTVTAAFAPNPPPVQGRASLVVQISTGSVDAQGVVQAVPRAFGQIRLLTMGDWQVLGENPAIADGNGVATWEVRCRTPGRQDMSVVVDDVETYPLTVPACVEQPPIVLDVPPTTSG